MFITPAFAQAAGGAAGGASSLLGSPLFPLLLILPVFYFVYIMPRNKEMKKHQEMLTAIRRGDTVVTTGGLIGKVSKVVDDKTVTVEVADNVRVQIVRSAISEVRSKGEPADAGAKPAEKTESKG
jgi:preprotein translocase subunit YajC